MTISFNNVPTGILLPLFYAEVDPSQANTGQQVHRSLMIGTMLGGGTATPGVPVPASTVDLGNRLAFRGSEAGRMINAFREGNSSADLWILPVAEPDGSPSAGTITITGTAGAPGTLAIYIAGQKVTATAVSGDSASTIANRLAIAINGNPDLPVTAAATSGSITVTCKWSGLTGNDITLVLNYRGLQGGEELPAGVSVAITAMAGGVGIPDIAGALAALGDEEFEYVGAPFSDTGSLDAFRDEWKDTDGGRWAWDRQLYGHVFTARRGTYSELYTFGSQRNDPHVSMVPVKQNGLSPVWEWAASSAAKSALGLSIDPARPLQTLALDGITAVKAEDQWTWQERNTLAHNGWSATRVMRDGTVQIENMTTTYQRNKFDVDDNSLLELNTPATLAYLLRDLRSVITSKYPRHKLANDGTNIGAGQAVVTPKVIKAEMVARYSEMEERGLVENMQAFKRHLIVERDTVNPNRVNVLYPPDLINQLRVFALLAQFRLQYPAGA